MTVDRDVLRSRIAAVLADACNAELNVPAGAPDACQPDSHADDARAVIELIEPLLKIADAARPTILASQATRRRVVPSEEAWYAPGLFCGAGGAGVGYHRAGFDVTGVDINPQPRYPFAFHQADALTFPLDGFDAYHASPVCYAWSKMRDCRPGTKQDQPDLITPLRPLLEATGRPYVIENVPGAPLVNPVRLCGSGFGLPLRRHRLFESNVALWGVPCAHGQNAWNPAYGHSTGRTRRRAAVIGDWRIPKHLQDAAMGIDWMTLQELTEAIPPAYTEHVGAALLDHLTSPAPPA